MGLIAGILRDTRLGDCSNDGISSTAQGVCLVNVEGPFEPTDGYAAALLVEGNLAGTVKIVPAELDENGDWYAVKDGVGPMMGGCYVCTSDSRFSKAVEKLLGHRFYGAVALHDRFETQAEYDALSR